jgi:hypothetical protein
MMTWSGYEHRPRSATRLSHARRVSENAFGILTKQFIIYNRLLKFNPENADFVILTTCILHNYLRDCNIRHSENCEGNTTLQNTAGQGGSAQSESPGQSRSH